MVGIGPIVGYAIGTLQILFIDWWRRIASHRRQLRLLQAELRRMRTFEATCGWEDGFPPADEHVPAPPKPTELLTKTLGEIEWVLTDEHSDDNTQQSFLHLLDGYAMLKHYADHVMSVADQVIQADDDMKERLRKRGAAYATAYDAKIDEVLYLTDDALRDLARRLDEVRFRPQLRRAFTFLPQRSNPAPLQPNDPRLAEWKAKQSAGEAADHQAPQ